MQITSPAFNDHELVPVRYTCNGPNINPPLEFLNIPTGTKSLVLLVEDVDAPAKPWVHWLVFNISPDTQFCPENSIPGTEGLANGGTFGYEGPCPKYFAGTHHYHFVVYALDCMLDLLNDSDRPAVLLAMENHILTTATMVGLAEGEKIEG